MYIHYIHTYACEYNHEVKCFLNIPKAKYLFIYVHMTIKKMKMEWTFTGMESSGVISRSFFITLRLCFMYIFTFSFSLLDFDLLEYPRSIPAIISTLPPRQCLYKPSRIIISKYIFHFIMKPLNISSRIITHNARNETFASISFLLYVFESSFLPFFVMPCMKCGF